MVVTQHQFMHPFLNSVMGAALFLNKELLSTMLVFETTKGCVLLLL
jgi:hypothetical protein